MQAINTILVGMDWSEAAIDAWKEACLIARTFGARVVLAHAVPDGLAPQDAEVVNRRVGELLDDLAKDPAAQGVRAVASRVAQGRPSARLLELADAESADLIVLGVGARTALDRVLLGTTAEKVVRESSRPVWLVPPGGAREQLRRVTCALDPAAPDPAALAAAVYLCRTFVAPLTVLGVVPGGEPLGARLAGLVGVATGPGSTAEAEAALRKALGRIDTHGLTVDVAVRAGKPAPELVDGAAAARADLLVLGAIPRSGVARLTHSSVAERVVRHATLPVLVVKEPHA